MFMVAMDRGSAAERLERGEVLFYPTAPFALPQGGDLDFLLQQELGSLAHKNISYNPHNDKVNGFVRRTAEQVEQLRGIFARFSQAATEWMAELLPQYSQGWQLDRASFRPQEEATRRLRAKARNDLVHVDAFPGRPSRGNRILRVFANINPREPRIWVTSDPFAKLLKRYGEAAGLPARNRTRWLGTLGQSVLGLFRPQVGRRSEYDLFMLRFHDYLKLNEEFQEKGPKYLHTFPPGCVWLAMTDTCSHAVLRGRFALEHSYFISPAVLTLPEESPLALLRMACEATIRRAPLTEFNHLSMTRHWPVLGIVIALLAGALLRLIWPADIEYKADEAWTFQHSRAAEFPWMGMPSSVDIPNPGMSLWVFTLLQRLSGAEDPPALARAIQLVNVAALILLAGFAFRCVPRGEREAWLWAAALVAVNPLAVLFHRKIWPPCVLPLLTLAMLFGWWYRRRRGPAFLWGLLGVCLGQIHMSGFFFAGGFVLWALLFDRPWRQRVAWRSWLLGSALGALPMLPWLIHLLRHPSGRPINPHRWVHAFEMKFWVRWYLESFGLGIDYTFGPYFREFLRYPLLAGRPTYLVAVLHCFVAVVALSLLARAVVLLWRQRRRWGALWIGRDSASAFTQSAALWGFGLLLTLSSFSIHRHYMIVLFPLEFLWLARLTLSPRHAAANAAGSPRLARTVLFSLCCAQFLLSANMLAYVHTRQNFAGAEYGVSYAAQHTAR